MNNPKEIDVAISWKKQIAHFKCLVHAMSKNQTEKEITRSVVFYDGDCFLCNKVVNHLSKIKNLPDHFRFSSQSGALFQELKSEFPQLKDIDAIVYLEYHGEIHESNKTIRHSGDAVTRIFSLVNSKYRFLRWIYGKWPRLGDAIYQIFASNRSKFNNNTCPVPSKTLLDRMV